MCPSHHGLCMFQRGGNQDAEKLGGLPGITQHISGDMSLAAGFHQVCENPAVFEAQSGRDLPEVTQPVVEVKGGVRPRVALCWGGCLAPTVWPGGRPFWDSRGCALISPALSSTPFSSPTMNHAFPCTNPSTLPRGSHPMSPRTTMGRRRQRRREHKSSCK